MVQISPKNRKSDLCACQASNPVEIDVPSWQKLKRPFAGWRLGMKGRKPSIGGFRLEVAKYIYTDAEYQDGIGGDELVARAKLLSHLASQHFAVLLLEHQEKLEQLMEPGAYLLFPGTVWLDDTGERYIPCICRDEYVQDEKNYFLHFRSLDQAFGPAGRLVVFGPQPSHS